MFSKRKVVGLLISIGSTVHPVVVIGMTEPTRLLGNVIKGRNLLAAALRLPPSLLQISTVTRPKAEP